MRVSFQHVRQSSLGGGLDWAIFDGKDCLSSRKANARSRPSTVKSVCVHCAVAALSPPPHQKPTFYGVCVYDGGSRRVSHSLECKCHPIIVASSISPLGCAVTNNDSRSVASYTQAHSSMLYAFRTISQQYAHMVNEHATINRLPIELLVRVFGFVDHDDLVASSLVCQHWRETAVNTPFLWQHLQVAVPPEPHRLRGYRISIATGVVAARALCILTRLLARMRNPEQEISRATVMADSGHSDRSLVFS